MLSFFSRLMFWKSPSPQVAVVRLSGIIAASGSPVRRGLSFESVEAPLKKAFSMGGIKAVALVINSPGGSPVQSQLISQYIRQLSKKHDVPVLGFCEDVAASGGYWIAAACDEIYASSLSVIGSIGVVSAGFGFPRAIEKLGIERRVYTSGLSKSMLDPFKDEKSEDVSHLKQLQTEIHDNFIAHVKTRRGSRLKADDELLFNGKFWTGETALSLGLVDGLGTMRDILETRFGDKLKLATVSQKKGLLSSFGSSAAVTLTRGGISSDGLVDEVSSKIYELHHWQRFGL